jgi:hypothetical protein
MVVAVEVPLAAPWRGFSCFFTAVAYKYNAVVGVSTVLALFLLKSIPMLIAIS